MNLFVKKAPAAIFPPPGRLQAYNRLVLQHQDETYSLAFDLVGDEALASEIVKEALLTEFGRENGHQGKFRLDVLRLVILGCLSRQAILSCPQFLERYPVKLSNDEILVCILVERLELSYQESAIVLVKPLLSIRKILAETRYKLIVGAMEDHG